jgi:hypothetical protein
MGIVNKEHMAIDLASGAFWTGENEVQTKIHRFIFFKTSFLMRSAII